MNSAKPFELTYYLAQSLPNLHEDDEYGMPSEMPSWALFTIIAVSIGIPLLLWSRSKREEKDFAGCATLALGMAIVLTVLGDFAFGVGFKGILIFAGIAVAISLLVKAVKAISHKPTTLRKPSPPPPSSLTKVGTGTRSLPAQPRSLPPAEVGQSMGVITEPFNFLNPRIGNIIYAPYGMVLCGIPPGEFFMGSPTDELGHRINENLVNVRISKGFWMARTQCTQEQWKRVMGTNPSRFSGPQHPVEQITWEEANEFCAAMTKIQHDRGELPLEAKWSLPSEAQWEYACRAGSPTNLNHGKSISTSKGICKNLNEVAWCNGNSEGRTHPVAQKRPNDWGLYDMHGNVWEWCRDWYHDLNGGGQDPCNLETGQHRAIRGGGWGDHPWACRSASRHQNPLPKDSDFGFRPIICW